MPSEIDLTLRVIESNTAAINNVAAALDELNDKTKESDESAKKQSNTWTELSSQISVAKTVMGGLQQAYQMYNQAVDATIGKTAAYAAEVGGLQRISGQTTEETSRVIQVFDDMGVSTGQLEAATKKLSSEGLSLNINTLANLSDEYLRLAPGADRAAFLTDKFGKSGLDMARAMEKGGAALREMADAQSGALILTNTQAAAYEQWSLSVDATEDSVASLSAAIGNYFVSDVTAANEAWSEFVNNLAEGVNEGAKEREILIRTTEILKEQSGAMSDQAFGRWKSAHQDAAAAARKQAEEEINLKNAAQETVPALDEEADSEKELQAAEEARKKALEELTRQNQEYISMVSQVAGAVASNEQQVSDLAQKKVDLQAKYNQLYASGYRSTAEGSQLGGVLDEMKAVDAQITETAANYRDQMNQMIAADALKILSTDGLTTAERDYYMKVQKDLGLITQEQIDQANKIQEAAAAIAAAAPGGTGEGGAPVPGQASAVAQGGAEAGAAAQQWTDTQKAADKYAEAVANDSKDVMTATDELTQKFVQKTDVVQELTDIEMKSLSTSAENWRAYSVDVGGMVNGLTNQLVDLITKLEQALALYAQLAGQTVPGSSPRGGMQYFGAYSTESIG